MALEDTKIAFHIMTEKKNEIVPDEAIEFEVDSFDFGDRFDMEFDAGF